MKIPLITFIVPDYNLPVHLLTACLQSIMDLPLNEDQREIILVDDGSDVSPLNGLGDYTKHIIYIRQRNGGLSAARNRGLELSRGKYIQFVDGDDQLLPSYTFCLSLINRKPELDIVMFNYTHQPKDSELRDCQDACTDKIQFTNPVSGPEWMLHHSLHASACGYIFKRSILGNLRFPTGLLHEDEEFTPLLMLRADAVTHIGRAAYMYRVRENSIMQNFSREWIDRRLSDFYQILQDLRQAAGRESEYNRQALSRRIHQLTTTYLYLVIYLNKDFRRLEQHAGQLTKDGFLPLPDKRYNFKYTWFRRLTLTKTGRRLLYYTLRNHQL